MAVRGKGSIINIASDIGVISPNQNIYKSDKYGYKGVPFNSPAFYAVSKAGIIHLTKYLATYWAEKNVRCNALAPGGISTNQPKLFKKKLSKLIPLGRMARQNEYKETVLYMISDASSYMNGFTMIVDGGRTIW